MACLALCFVSSACLFAAVIAARQYQQYRLDSRLYTAIRAGDAEKTTFLLEHGADANARFSQENPSEPNHDLLHFWQDLLQWWQQSRRHDALRPALYVALTANAENYLDEPPPLLPSTTPIVAALLKHGADPNVLGPDDEPMLDLAAGRDSSGSVVRLLLDHGARMYDTLSRSTMESATAITGPILIERGISLRFRAPLHSAMLRGENTLVQLLLKHGADARREFGAKTTPFLGFYFGRIDHRTLELLLIAGANPNITDRLSGESLLQSAMYERNRDECVKQVQILIRYGADVKHRDHSGQNAMDIAKAHGRTYLLPILTLDRRE